MGQVGIRELKQYASEVVARAEKGESIDITLRGRPVARLIPIRAERRPWLPGSELGEAFAALGPDTTGWLEEHHESRENDPLLDPWDATA